MVEAAKGSPLDRVLEKIARRREAVHHDIRVDGLSDFLGEDVFVRYHAAIGADEFARKNAKIKPDAPALALFLTALVELCGGVYIVTDGKPVGLTLTQPVDPDEWPRFDEDLKAVLEPGFPLGITNTAAAIARSLFEAGHSPDNRLQAHAEITKHYREVQRWIASEDSLGGDDGLGG